MHKFWLLLNFSSTVSFIHCAQAHVKRKLAAPVGHLAYHAETEKPKKNYAKKADACTLQTQITRQSG